MLKEARFIMTTTMIERIPDAELEVMLVLWHAEKPLNVSEITGKLAEARPWKSGTVHVLLARLEERGFVACDKSEYKHRFSPIISEKAYRKGEKTRCSTAFSAARQRK